MIRTVLNLIKIRRQGKAEDATLPEQGSELSDTGETVCFKRTFPWGDFEIALAVRQGSIEEAGIYSNCEYKELINDIGLYLSGKKYERKEILKTLDIIPVENEEENAVMRDVYNLLDQELYE